MGKFKESLNEKMNEGKRYVKLIGDNMKIFRLTRIIRITETRDVKATSLEEADKLSRKNRSAYKEKERLIVDEFIEKI